MNFKYCYKDEIHKSFKIPPTLEALIQDITASFKTKLPPNFNIRYKDMDGDFITISSDVEYHSMLKFDTPANTRTSFKIFIVSPRDNATDEKEPSFEVIDSGNNTSQGGISEFSLTSKDCEEIPTERPSTSSQKDDNNTSTTERDRAPANSLQRSRVLNDTSDWKDDQLSFPDGEEESVSFGDETFNHAYKPVVSSPRQELVSPSLSGDSDMKVSLGREQQENSLEKIFDKMQPLDCRSIDFKEEEVNHTNSKENSVVLREIDNFMDKLTEQKKEMVPGSSDTEIKPMFNAQRIMPLDLFDRRRREKIMKIKNRSACIIQRAFRTHQLQKEFDKFRIEHRISTQEAVVGLTNLIKARLQALIEAQLPIQPVHQTFEPTHITPQEVSFEQKRMPWEPETTEPNCYSFEKSATEERCMEASLPHISRDCLICGDLRYCEHITDNDNNNNDDEEEEEGYYRACSDNNLSLHDSRVESPYLDDLLNQSNSQAVEDTRLELPVIENKPAQSFGYRVMLGMSSSLLFLGGEEGQGVVYKTIYLENTGPKPWRKCYVKSVGLIEGKTLEFYNVDVGEISLVTLELNGYFTAGTYSSQWRLIHENEHGMMEPIGEVFEIEFMIESQNIINTLESLLPRKFTDEYPSQDFIYKYLAHDEEEDEATERYRDSFRDRTEDEQEEGERQEEQEEEQEEEEEEYQDEEEEEEYEEEEEEEEEQYEDEEEEEEEEYYDEEEEYEDEEEEDYEDDEEEEYDEEEEEEEEYEERDEDREKEERFKKYIDYKDEIYKIREMRKIFPLESLDELIEFVDNRPQLTVEELLIGYLAMKNKY